MAKPFDLEEFWAYFRGDFDRQLKAVKIPGVESASWDRRAAYLLYCATVLGGDPLPEPEEAPEDWSDLV